jgi:hypothetical protein
MPLRRAVDLYEKVRRSVFYGIRMRLTELQPIPGVVFDLTNLQSGRETRRQGCGAFVKSIVAAVGGAARTVAVTRRSPN